MKIRKTNSQRKLNDVQTSNNKMQHYKPYINTFRQIMENMDKKNNQSNSIKDSPKTFDYLQIMNKYSHLINEENSYNKDKIYNNTKIFDQKKNFNLNKNNYYTKTEINNNTCNKNQNNINTNLNHHFQFCKTENALNEKEDDEAPNNYKYYTFKNFYHNPSSTSNGNITTNIETNTNINYTNINNKKYTNFFPNNLKYSNNNRDNNNMINRNYNNNTCRGNYRSTKKNNYFNTNTTNNKNNIHSRSSGNIGINNEMNKFFNFKQKIISLEKENSSLKKYNNNLFNKINKFISLCQKYGENFENSSNYFELNTINTNQKNNNKNTISNNESLGELKYLFEQYNNMLNNISKMFKKWDPKYDPNNEEVLNLNKFEPKSLNYAEKYITKIKNLKNEKTEIFEELNEIKKKNKNLQLEKEQYELLILKLRNEIETLNSEIKKLKNIENNYLKQNNIINKLKCQIETLNIDIKYKENTINNLQKILEQLKIKTNDKKFTIKDFGENDKESNFLLDINFDSIERDIIIPSNKKVNSIAELDAVEIGNKMENSEFTICNKEEQPINNINILHLKHNLTPKHNILYKENLNYNVTNELEDNEIINKQMKKLDQDILDLKTKLKKKIPK